MEKLFSVLNYKNTVNSNNLHLKAQSCSDVYERNRANVLSTLITLLASRPSRTGWEVPLS